MRRLSAGGGGEGLGDRDLCRRARLLRELWVELGLQLGQLAAGGLVAHLVADGADAGAHGDIADLAKQGAAKALDSLKAPGALKGLIGKDLMESTVREVIASDLFSTFLNSDEMKVILDDKFKMMRNWLKNDEIPKQVKKLTTS